MRPSGLNGKVALVTGANHGIGAATAKALAAEGAAVFISYMRVPVEATLRGKSVEGNPSTPGMELYALKRTATADEVVREIRDQGGRVEAWEVDLAETTAISSLFDRVDESFGRVDVLVNNAAHWESDTFIPGALHSITPESHDRHFAVNSRAVALMMAEFARRHVRRGADWGRIINVSTDGASAFGGEISYGASKHAMESYSRAAAGELKSLGITVNVVSPGPIQTGYISRELAERLAGYVGQPEDIADVIVFLASDQARWVTGQLLYVGGGHQMPL
jgi:3-oxoacyl-[acyl-carrier protein] reductase